MTEPTRKVYDLAQAAEVLAGVSIDFLRCEYRAGRIAVKKLGKKKYVITDAEHRYIDDLPSRWPTALTRDS